MPPGCVTECINRLGNFTCFFVGLRGVGTGNLIDFFGCYYRVLKAYKMFSFNKFISKCQSNNKFMSGVL